jgi:F0F1-type ATP synthase assembly protein I
VLAILILPTDSKVVAVVGTILNTIIDSMFLASTITLIVIMLYGEVSSTYKYW